jgi:hypothetical protein
VKYIPGVETSTGYVGRGARYCVSLLVSLERFSVFSSAGTGSKGCEVHPRRRDEYRLCRKRSTVLCFSFDLSVKSFRFF